MVALPTFSCFREYENKVLLGIKLLNYKTLPNPKGKEVHKQDGNPFWVVCLVIVTGILIHLEEMKGI
jgi:hypothetical protein